MIADSRCWVHRAAAGGNCDLADDTENGRIRLCIDAGSSQDSELMGTAARETPASRAAVPKVPGSWREEIGSPLRTIRLLPFHPRNRSSHRPGATLPACK